MLQIRRKKCVIHILSPFAIYLWQTKKERVLQTRQQAFVTSKRERISFRTFFALFKDLLLQHIEENKYERVINGI